MEKSFDQVAAKIKIIEQEAPEITWVQLDIMDGKFVPNATWRNPQDLIGIKTNLHLEVHLMIDNPQASLREWLLLKTIRRLLIHQETVSRLKLRQLVRTIKDRQREVGVALNPGTSIDTISDLLPILDEVLMMGVNPGFSGQSFKVEVLRKIKELHQLVPSLPIAVDGGVDLDTAPQLIQAGATRLCAASYLWQSENIAKSILALKEPLKSYAQ